MEDAQFGGKSKRCSDEVETRERERRKERDMIYDSTFWSSGPSYISGWIWNCTYALPCGHEGSTIQGQPALHACKEEACSYFSHPPPSFHSGPLGNVRFQIVPLGSTRFEMVASIQKPISSLGWEKKTLKVVLLCCGIHLCLRIS